MNSIGNDYSRGDANPSEDKENVELWHQIQGPLMTAAIAGDSNQGTQLLRECFDRKIMHPVIDLMRGGGEIATQIYTFLHQMKLLVNFIGKRPNIEWEELDNGRMVIASLIPQHRYPVYKIDVPARSSWEEAPTVPLSGIDNYGEVDVPDSDRRTVIPLSEFPGFENGVSEDAPIQPNLVPIADILASAGVDAGAEPFGDPERERCQALDEYGDRFQEMAGVKEVDVGVAGPDDETFEIPLQKFHEDVAGVVAEEGEAAAFEAADTAPIDPRGVVDPQDMDYDRYCATFINSLATPSLSDFETLEADDELVRNFLAGHEELTIAYNEEFFRSYAARLHLAGPVIREVREHVESEEQLFMRFSVLETFLMELSRYHEELNNNKDLLEKLLYILYDLKVMQPLRVMVRNMPDSHIGKLLYNLIFECGLSVRFMIMEPYYLNQEDRALKYSGCDINDAGSIDLTKVISVLIKADFRAKRRDKVIKNLSDLYGRNDYRSIFEIVRDIQAEDGEEEAKRFVGILQEMGIWCYLSGYFEAQYQEAQKSASSRTVALSDTDIAALSSEPPKVVVDWELYDDALIKGCELVEGFSAETQDEAVRFFIELFDSGEIETIERLVSRFTGDVKGFSNLDAILQAAGIVKRVKTCRLDKQGNVVGYRPNTILDERMTEPTAIGDFEVSAQERLLVPEGAYQHNGRFVAPARRETDLDAGNGDVELPNKVRRGVLERRKIAREFPESADRDLLEERGVLDLAMDFRKFFRARYEYEIPVGQIVSFTDLGVKTTGLACRLVDSFQDEEDVSLKIDACVHWIPYIRVGIHNLVVFEPGEIYYLRSIAAEERIIRKGYDINRVIQEALAYKKKDPAVMIGSLFADALEVYEPESEPDDCLTQQSGLDHFARLAGQGHPAREGKGWWKRRK